MATKAPARTSGTRSPSVSVDIGAAAVRVVEIDWSAGEDNPHLLRRAVAALPPNAWNELPASRSVFAEAIKSAMASAGITAKNVVACFPRRLVTLRMVQVPPAPPEHMRGMITLEAQQHILFSLDEVVLDYHVLADPLAGVSTSESDDMTTVLLAAARRSLVADLMAIFELAGLEVERLCVSALALSELIRDALEPTALVDVKPGEMDVAVVADGRLLFTRASALDGEGLQPEVALRRFAEEVARSFTSYQNEFRNRPLLHVLLAGTAVAGLAPQEVSAALTDVLEMPVVLLHNRMMPASDADARSYAAAVGTVLEVGENAVAPIDLIPDERAQLRAQAVAKRRKRVAGALAAVGLVFVAFLVRSSIAAAARNQRLARDANLKLKDITDQVTVEKKKHDAMQAVGAALDQSLDRRHPSVDVFAALSQSLPRSSAIWLTQLSFDRGDQPGRGGTITLRGNTKSQGAVDDLVINLQGCLLFRQVHLVYLGDAQENDTGAGKPAPVKSAAVGTTPVLPGLAPGKAAGPPSAHGGLAAKGVASAQDQSGLTSFTITCRVNPKVDSMVALKSTSDGKFASARPVNRRRLGAIGDSEPSNEDTGGGADEDQ